MEQLFVSKNDLVANYMKREWEKTVEVVANSMAVLQIYIKRTKKRDLALDSLTLAGLVAKIGVLPILTEAERHSEVFANPTFLEDAIDKMSGKIGANIMKAWGFSEEFTVVSASLRDLSVIPEQLSYLDFVRVGAVLSGQMDSQKDAVLNLAVQRGALTDLNELASDEFKEMCESAKLIFA